MKIAVVEDDFSLSNLLKRFLSKEGYSVKLFSTAEALFESIFSYEESFDLIVLDVMLPGVDGFSAVSFLRERRVEVPILLLTALSQEDDKVKGLDSGADDYLTKPFGLKELSARVRALLRRHGVRKGEGVYLTKDRAVVDGKEVRLTTKEKALLELLMQSKGKVVSKEELFLKVWKGKGSKRVVDVYVKHLRDKIGDRIETVWGEGYRLVE
ncbi:response regulator transcription factor [Thermovibrio sp.]